MILFFIAGRYKRLPVGKHYLLGISPFVKCKGEILSKD